MAQRRRSYDRNKLLRFALLFRNTGVNKAMYFFPSRDQVQLAKWAEVVKNGKSFRPNRNHRVCEDHFYTGKPSPTNIHPGKFAKKKIVNFMTLVYIYIYIY